VRRRYAELAAAGVVADAELNDARIRMAMLPRGARALDNEVGAAPGIVLSLDRTMLVALPGVPPELVWIWEHPLAPILDELLGPGGFHEVTFQIDSRDESAIAPLLQDIQSRHPQVYVKSRAHGFGDEDLLRITLHATGESDEAARALADAASDELQSALADQGVTIRDAGS
jgi:molybdopterin-biosynthesis enzyme MoeA-like protein